MVKNPHHSSFKKKIMTYVYYSALAVKINCLMNYITNIIQCNPSVCGTRGVPSVSFTIRTTIFFNNFWKSACSNIIIFLLFLNVVYFFFLYFKTNSLTDFEPIAVQKKKSEKKKWLKFLKLRQMEEWTDVNRKATRAKRVSLTGCECRRHQFSCEWVKVNTLV